jgi:hypothetical protein
VVRVSTTRAVFEYIVITLPRCRSIIPGRKVCTQRKVEVRFWSRISLPLDLGDLLGGV